MAANFTYYVTRQLGHGPEGVWHTVMGSTGNRSYALGWFHALTSFYPRPAYALMRFKDDPKTPETVEESHAVRAPSTCT